ncbi:RteC domain-containing protein [Aquimarina algiphila]|uniref:RteC domain-containing protein n=1 Tax=Aquimarina algiphila TaxID=2047982 RepID=UPI00232EFADD|nr:RteC domain-containing protein [Aquimarina algiphila]
MEYLGLTEKLHNELDQIQVQTSNENRKAVRSIIICRNYLSRLRKEIVEKGFKDPKEEIRFFKNVKTVPFSQLIYYTEIHNFELSFPENCIEIQEKYIKKHLKKYNSFFLRNIDFGQYIELECTHFDAYYFTRKSNNELPVGTSRIYVQDTEFNTPKDALLAQFKGYGLMVLYLKQKLFNLSKDDGKSFPKESFNLKCAASKTDIIELTYALIASGAVQGDIKELVKAFELIFNIDLGDFYRTFIAIRDRALDPVKFLDLLKSALLKRMEEVDN